MNILVVNGSPAGKNSITLQTVEYLKALFPAPHYEILHVGQRIRTIEKDFGEARRKLLAADLILFCYPVYTFLVPAQLHRFIELIKEDGLDLSRKYATQITTSKHFYDMTAHRFIEENCADLHLRVLRGLSADMEDLLSEKGRREARTFFRFVLWNMHKGYCEPVRRLPREADYCTVPAAENPGRIAETAEHTAMSADNAARPDDHAIQSAETAAAAKAGPSGSRLRIALVTDYDPGEDDSPLLTMIRRFRHRFPGDCECINLREFPFGGGCLGCFHCASDGTCIYKDGFDDFLRQHINSADAVVYAYTIRDHSMGYRFKLYDDRQFCNDHRTVTMGKPVGYLVDGNLAEEENLRTLMEARAEVGGNFLAGIVSDQENTDVGIDQLLETLIYAVRHKYTPPKNFYGVGGLKIFRDLIYEMQGLMQEDHRFYKEHGFYDDFPQKKRGRIAAMYLVSALMKNPALQKKSKISMTDGMLLPYRKVIERAVKKK